MIFPILLYKNKYLSCIKINNQYKIVILSYSYILINFKTYLKYFYNRNLIDEKID